MSNTFKLTGSPQDLADSINVAIGLGDGPYKLGKGPNAAYIAFESSYGPPPPPSLLLLEDGSYLLQEDGFKIKL